MGSANPRSSVLYLHFSPNSVVKSALQDRGDRDIHGKGTGTARQCGPDGETRRSQHGVRDIVTLGRSPYTGILGRLYLRMKPRSTKLLISFAYPLSQNVWYIPSSDGERQKAMIAKALAQNTPIIYLDEPTAFLDFPSKWR